MLIATEATTFPATAGAIPKLAGIIPAKAGKFRWEAVNCR
jgi:hypothetical protein